jgi:hypothetical protein
MSIIKDYWSKWLAGETTDKEVDGYIRSAFAHLVFEYRSVYFLKCVCKENLFTQDINSNEAADAEEQSQNQEGAQAQGTVSSQENLAGIQTESTLQGDTGEIIIAQEQNQTQNLDQNQKLEQLESAAGAQESLVMFQPESTLQGDSGDAIIVEEQNRDQKEAKDAAIGALESSKSDQILSNYVCQQSPELRTLLEGFDKGDFNEGKKNLSWDDCALLEVSIIRLLDKNQLKTKLAMLEARYEAVVEPIKYERYKQSVIRGSGDDTDLKERIYFLVWDLYWAYTTAGKVGQLRQRAVKPILGILPIIISVVFIFFLIYLLVSSTQYTSMFSTFMMVLSVVFFGAFGALISFQRRMSKLEVRGETFSNYLQLCSLGNEGPLALFAGGFFAVLLLILFGSGMANVAVKAIFSDGLANTIIPLFPNLYIKNNASAGIVNLATAIGNLNFMSFASIAKLLVWSFLAGFAEALIPDAMTRLIEKAKLMEK